MSLLARDTLDRAKCDEPGCTCSDGPVFLHPKCHVTKPVWASYLDGVLVLACAECGAVVARIAVADKAPEDAEHQSQETHH